MAHNFTQLSIVNHLRTKKFPRVIDLLLDSSPTEDMNPHQIAGIALLMYTQGGALFEQLSKLFLVLGAGEEDQVL